MGVYAVTGSASGMGRQAADKLRAAGNSVIGVDLRDADVIADIVLDPENWQVAYAVDNFNVYKTDNGGLSWLTLRQPPVRDIQTVELVRTSGTTALLVGGLGGVQRMLNPDDATSAWGTFGIQGEDGIDLLYGGADNDSVLGGRGNDVI